MIGVVEGEAGGSTGRAATPVATTAGSQKRIVPYP